MRRKFSKYCPCDLLIVIANAKRIGNCFLYNLNEKNEFFSVFDVIRCIKTVEPIFFPIKIAASILYFYKFIDIKYHYTKERVEDESVRVEYISTKNQIADIFTKPLGPIKFLKLRKLLGLE